ncbi:AAA family ATPase [Vibrio vulnificus]|nr:ATP-binding protein [Vibrio vulnificus]EIA1286619.1 AAA family ATPase [Vibrio vulnificus]
MNQALSWQELNPYFIKKVEVQGLLSKKNIEWNLEDVNVLVGRNGSGKSTLLDVIRLAILGPDVIEPSKLAEKFSSITVTFNNGKQSVCNITDPEEHEDEMLSAISSFLDRANGYQDPDIDKLRALYNDINSARLTSESNYRVKFFASGVSDWNIEDRNTLLKFANVEYISTFDMILLSKEEQDKHAEDLETYSQLDVLISKEIDKLSRLITRKNNKTIDDYSLKLAKDTKDLMSISKYNMMRVLSFLEKLNNLFRTEDKYFQTDSSGMLTIECNDKIISHKDLSSGEKQLLFILLKTINTSDKPTIMFLDEPEISMHLKWQEELISSLNDINPNLQIIAVSHSPALVMRGWLGALSDIADISN